MKMNTSHHCDILAHKNQFDEKIFHIFNQIDEIVKNDLKTINIKRYIDKYHLEKNIQEREDRAKSLEEKENRNTFSKGKSPTQKLSVGLDEIQKHKDLHEKEKIRLIALKEIERMKQYEKMKLFNKKIASSMQYSKNNIENFEKKKEIHEDTPDIRNKKKKEFCKIVQTHVKPKMGLSKIRREENIIQAKEDRRVESRKKYGRIILKKVMSKDKNNEDRKLKKANTLAYGEVAEKKKQVHTPVEIRKPLTKMPDYLKEVRDMREHQRNHSQEAKRIREKKWEQLLNEHGVANNEEIMKNIQSQKSLNEYNNNLYSSIENIKLQAKILEEKASMKGQLLRVSGGAKHNPQVSENISQLLLDSIKAKLVILNRINKE